MQIIKLGIQNFKSILQMQISDIENALILVGKNNTGKTAVLDAIRAVSGQYKIQDKDFQEDYPNIEIEVSLKLNHDDLYCMQEDGIVSQYRRYESWYKDFCEKLPSYQEGILDFTFVANREGKIRYSDGYQKNNSYIPQILPNVYYIDSQRSLDHFQENILMLQEDELLKQMRTGCCMFDRAKKCNHCFSCIGLLNQKTTEELYVVAFGNLRRKKQKKCGYHYGGRCRNLFASEASESIRRYFIPPVQRKSGYFFYAFAELTRKF